MPLPSGGRSPVQVTPVVLAVLVVALAAGLVLVPSPRGPSPTPEAAAAPARPSRPPNVVVVMADDMRVDDLRFAPHVRRLMSRHGVTFTNSFSPYPLCCPARASFLTGQYAHNHRVWSHRRPFGYRSFDDSRTLATSLRRAGYRTGFVGKYLNGYGPDRSRVSGRPSWQYVPRGWTDWRASFSNPGVRGIHGGTYSYFDTPYNVNGRVDNRYRGRYQTEVVGDFATSMARRFAGAGGPFFLYVSFVAPHFGSPVEPDDPGWVRGDDGVRRDFVTPARPRWVEGRFDRVVRRGAGMPRDGGPAERDTSDKPRALRSHPEPNRRERRALREVTRQRAEAVFVLDRQVARLVRELKRSGEWRRTVLMFTSDNGYYLGEHRIRQGKIRQHEPSIRVPLLVTGPGMRSGEQRHTPVSTVDLTATILDLADARPPRRPDGTSRVSVLRGADAGWDVPVVLEATDTAGQREDQPGFADRRTIIGFRTARYSYARHRTGEREMYDLLTDPLQLQNLARSREHRALRAALDEMWWEVRNCRGGECRVPLPPDLAATAGQVRELTRGYWAAVDDAYGW